AAGDTAAGRCEGPRADDRRRTRDASAPGGAGVRGVVRCATRGGRCAVPLRGCRPVDGMRIIGLTGGIGMGKSTAAAAFRRAGMPVFDADLAVHRVQARGGRAVKVIEAAFPGSVKDGAVDRAALRGMVINDRAALTRLERILHPMVEQEERA